MTNGSDFKRMVRDSYDRLDERYAEWGRTIEDTSRRRWTDFLLESMPAGSRVLDLGCGDGSLLTGQLAERFSVVGVDLSAAQLARASKSLPNAHFICADMTSLAFPDESFDAVCAFYSFTHLPLDELPGLLCSIAAWLRHGGRLVGSFGASEDPGSVQSDWLGVPMFFSGHAPEENRRLVERAGLTVEHDSVESATEFEQDVTFHWIAARK